MAFRPIRTTTKPERATIPKGGTIARQIAFLGFVGGFLGFSNILGFDHYYGKNEYNNDADDDGHWGIWDEPFFQYMCRTYSEKEQPFLGTIFTLSSHHPFQIPKQYEGKALLDFFDRKIQDLTLRIEQTSEFFKGSRNSLSDYFLGNL